MKAAEAGDFGAADELGRKLRSSHPFDERPLDPVTWWKKATQGGSIGAMMNLAERYVADDDDQRQAEGKRCVSGVLPLRVQARTMASLILAGDEDGRSTQTSTQCHAVA